MHPPPHAQHVTEDEFNQFLHLCIQHPVTLGCGPRRTRATVGYLITLLTAAKPWVPSVYHHLDGDSVNDDHDTEKLSRLVCD